MAEVEKWTPFNHPDGIVRDLSFLDAHEVVYVHTAEGKEDITYRFWVTYSFHCFAKDYDHQTPEETVALMYSAGDKGKRPFCDQRYNLARKHLRGMIESLDKSRVIHAGYGSYAVFEMDLGNGEKLYYYVVFKAFREKKKLRLHITSAYPVTERPGGAPANFFSIAFALRGNRPLPVPPGQRKGRLR
ncbi:MULTISPECIES: stationary phase growth adaptation protein [unclassified Pantoea]|uniref:stationary phase growth adaptation protein n=1 Tax=unclassified Pantoea TaxID=2630326 RepID=UPI001CD7BBE3|nr:MULTISPECIES: stationary phase growth adaptation protein [unclassified Pantoea]MCA1179510.1 stationary phase growth adaptation protein [Pantoea sp. alder69]MCA1251763.1 stationary phase growth adaptation protein [Pantoea sp. alder70]MCA1267900.1 stationary phase growth adaptation protein [Pantoea sp. alder81]